VDVTGSRHSGLGFTVFWLFTSGLTLSASANVDTAVHVYAAFRCTVSVDENISDVHTSC